MEEVAPVVVSGSKYWLMYHDLYNKKVCVMGIRKRKMINPDIKLKDISKQRL